MANAIPPGVADAIGLLGGAERETWEDRLFEAAYESPSGTRIRFAYEEVRRGFTLRGTPFEFAGINNAYVQKRGYGSRQYPMRVFFWGTDHDRIATAFEAALLEDGVGRLEHPMYGPVDVTPLGEVTRREDLKGAANQSVVEVTFWTTTGVVYPRATTNAKSEIEAALAHFDLAAAQQFRDQMDLSTASLRANSKATIKSFLRDVSAALQNASDSVAEIRREVADIQDSINLGLDVLVGQPLQLAQQIVNLVRAPARATLGFESRLAGYQDLAARIRASAAGAPAEALAAGAALTFRTASVANDFLIGDLYAMAAVSGSVETTIRTEFKTRREALLAADEVLSQYDDLTAWRDQGFTDLQALDFTPSQVDTGGAIQGLSAAVNATAGLLVQASFSLSPEIRVVLDRPRTIIDLAAELYGSVDDALDTLIENNNLTGDQILELPRGAVVVYYPRT